MDQLNEFASWYADLKIGHRIVGALGIILVLLLVVVVIMMGYINSLGARQKLLYEKSVSSMRDFVTVRNNITLTQNEILSILVFNSPSIRDKYIADIKEKTVETFKLIDSLKVRFKGDKNQQDREPRKNVA